MNFYLNDNTDCLNTKDSFNNVSGNLNISNHYTIPDHHPEILRWLSPLEPRVRHQDIQALRADSVGDWLLETREFRSWTGASREVNPENPALFCYGDPGVGKTYLSSLVIDRLGDEAKGKPDEVACFYFDFAARKDHTPANILGSLLKQIVEGLGRIPQVIARAFEDQQKVAGGRRLRVPEIVKILQSVTRSQRTFICVDAVDECAEEHRLEVLSSLREILEKSEGVRIFITGRRHIRREVEKHLGGKATMIPIKPSNEDIRLYIRKRLSKDTFPDAMDDGLEAEITESLAEKIPESFLLASITLESILQETTMCGRRERLVTMAGGSDVKDAYGATLERIKEQGGERARLGIAALMWISYSERPLQLDELLHALTVEIGSMELNPKKIPSLQTLLSCCIGLLAFDKGASRVRLIHFTLQEYLHTRPDLFPNAHSEIAETCLTYLNFRGIKDLSPSLWAVPQSAPFLQYCSLYWGVHAKRETSSGVISLALDTFSQSENRLSTKLLLGVLLPRLDRWWSEIPSDGHLVGFTGLHCASLLGISEIATTFTKTKTHDLNKRDFLSLTPLMWASAFGQECVVKLLLEQHDVHPNKVDKYHGRTALSWAAGMGHEGVVKLFLGRASPSPDGTDILCGTPRVGNLFSGRRHINLEKQDKNGETPLLRAAGNGHEGVVRLLLGRDDVSPDRAEKWRDTPISRAARNGHEGTVKLLLGRGDINPDRADQSGWTLLTHAAINGHEGVVRLLLGRSDVNPNRADRSGRTSLSWAASYGHEEVVKLLLGLDNVSPNIADEEGRTALSWAVSMGHEGVVKLLLERRDVNPGSASKSSQTPLSWAAINGSLGAVKLLLGPQAVGHNFPGGTTRSPLR